MLFDDLLDKKVSITQVRSGSKSVKSQKATLIGLGLRGINTSSELVASKDVLGMVKKVSHLIKVSAV
ncbi:MAG: Ribosomal protein L30p/L7e [Rickettsiaceae bacterium]|jgi:large subunit ribosomal protein L30|nr:Ribosomal protein L30p/L7e [Rickettsiaceae bacterium]